MSRGAIDPRPLNNHRIDIHRKAGVTINAASKTARQAMRIIEYGAKRIARGGAGGVFSERSRGFLARSLHTNHIPGSLSPELVSGVAYGRIQNYGGRIQRRGYSAKRRTPNKRTGMRTVYYVRPHTATYKGKFYAQKAYLAQAPKVHAVLRKSFDVLTKG